MRHYRAHFGLANAAPTRTIVFRHESDEPESHEILICLAGNEISDTLIAEGADPLAYRYGDPQPINEQEYANTCQQRMVITARHARAIVPHVTRVVTVKDSLAPCPECGNTDISAWADDGESDSSDWWSCDCCGYSGAFLHVDLSKRTTPNGLEVAS